MLRSTGGGSGSASSGGGSTPTLGTPSMFANKIGIFGDSISAADNNTGATAVTNQSQGIVSNLNTLAGKRFNFTVGWNGSTKTGYNFGTGGDTTALMLARITEVTSSGVDWCVVLGGTNDVPSVAVATTIANLTAIYQALQAVGIKVIAVPILPRTGLAAAAINRLNRVNRFIRDYNFNFPSANKIFVADPTKYMIIDSSATGDVIVANSYDGLHPNPAGAYYIAKAIWEVIEPYAPPPAYHLMQSVADVYDATNNPTGNLLVNGMINGTGGTVTAPATGTVAASWTADIDATEPNIVGVCSKGAQNLDGTSGETQIITWSTSSAGAGEAIGYFRQNVTTNYSPGDVIEVYCQFRVYDITGANFIGCSLVLATSGASPNLQYSDMNPVGATRLAATEDYTGVMLTQKMVVPASTTTLRFRIETKLDASKTGSVTIEIDRCGMRKVI